MRLKIIGFFPLLLTCFFWSNLNGQIVKIGLGSNYLYEFNGPLLNTSSNYAASRFAYVYAKKYLGGLSHGDTLRSVSFLKFDTNVLNPNCFLKIYCKMKKDTSYSKANINWVNLSQSSDAVLVYNKNPYLEFSPVIGYVKFPFSRPFVVDTAYGHNLEILVEFVQSAPQPQRILWCHSNQYTYFNYGRNNSVFIGPLSGALPDTTKAINSNLPVMKIEFPRYNQDIEVRSIYNLKKVASNFGNDDSVLIVLQNVGKRNSSFKVYIKSKGANANFDSVQMSLKSMEERNFSMPLKTSSAKGRDSIFVWVQSDDNNLNNLKSVVRVVNDYLFSYRDSAIKFTIGVGFSSNPGYTAMKFNIKDSLRISQINTFFKSNNQPFEIYVYDVDSTTGKPGNVLWVSDTLYSAPVIQTPIMPTLKTSGPFFIAVNQLDNFNIQYVSEVEQPLIPKTHFYKTDYRGWTDNEKINVFKPIYEPVVQVQNNVGTNIPFGIPADLSLYANPIAPKVIVFNSGLNDQTSPFDVKMTIYKGASLVYSSVKTITLKSELSTAVIFDSTFKPTTEGSYIMKVFTQLGNDMYRGNDTSIFKFVVNKYSDLGVDSVIMPYKNMVFEWLHDTLTPVVKFKNYGKDDMYFFVNADIFDSTGKRVYRSAFGYIYLKGRDSITYTFNKFLCNYEGKLKVRFYTSGFSDLYTSNDTVERFVYVVNKNDLHLKSINEPLNKQILDQPLLKPKCIIRNAGTLEQNSGAKTYAIITYNSNIVYSDSLTVNLLSNQESEFVFKDFVPSVRGYYQLTVYTKLKTDLNKKNDTLRVNFCYKLPDDVEILSVVPITSYNIVKFNKYKTGFTIRNNGYRNQNNQFLVRYQVVNSSNNIVYNKSVNVVIDSGITKVIYIDSTLVTYGGLYTIRVFSELASDCIRANDTFKAYISDTRQLDVAFSRFIFPTSLDTISVSAKNIKVSALVTSLGATKIKDSVNVKVRMFKIANGAEFYLDAKKVLIPDSGRLVINFKVFEADSMPVAYRVVGTISYYGDQDLSNDAFAFNNKFYIPYDIKVESINQPFNGKLFKDADTVLQPIVYIRNTGIFPLSGFYVWATIMYFDKSLNQDVFIYRDSVLVDRLNAGAFFSVSTFKKLDLRNLKGGDYKIQASSIVDDDGVNSNNNLESAFKISKLSSLESSNMLIFSVYPNPTSNQLNIDCVNADFPIKANIVDVTGRVLKTILLEGVHTVVDVVGLAKGVYFVKFGEGLIKFVVE